MAHNNHLPSVGLWLNASKSKSVFLSKSLDLDNFRWIRRTERLSVPESQCTGYQNPKISGIVKEKKWAENLTLRPSIYAFYDKIPAFRYFILLLLHYPVTINNTPIALRKPYSRVCVWLMELLKSLEILKVPKMFEIIKIQILIWVWAIFFLLFSIKKNKLRVAHLSFLIPWKIKDIKNKEYFPQ